MKIKITQIPLLVLFATILLQSCVGYNIAVDSYAKPESQFRKNNYPSKNYKDIPVYLNDERPTEAYEVMIRITVTGNASASREKLINKMKKEAGLYKADGLILLDEKFIIRESFDGISLALNIFSLFATYDTDCEPLDLPISNKYDTLKLEGIAYRYK